MRPIEKGGVPTDETGNPIEQTNYQAWRNALISRIGYYCVYCNQPLSHSLQVEHIVPKNPPEGYEIGDPLAWENLLLACGPCNNAKNNKTVDPKNYYLPEEHNTHLPFSAIAIANSEHAVIVAREGITNRQQIKAIVTIELTELNSIDKREKIVDIRSRKRYDAMAAIDACHQLYTTASQTATFDVSTAAHNVALIAISTGFFSLWYDRFAGEPEVMQALTNTHLIPGTAQTCFDAANGYQPISRNPTNPDDPF